MARYYVVKVGSIWLTSDGLETGRPCKIQVEGYAGLVRSGVGNVVVGADGTPFREIPLTPTGAGRPFAVTAAFMSSTVYDSIVAALDAAAAANTEINVTGAGAPGDFDVDAIVNDNPFYIAAESFSGDHLKNVRIALITTAIN